LTNVIIANSTGGDCYGTLHIESSHNLIANEFEICGLVHNNDGNVIGFSPNLAPLDDNGGFTKTHALLAGSPAINAGTSIGCPATDQRGIARPQGTTCDIGAYEALTIKIETSIGSSLEGTYSIFPSNSQRVSYAGLNTGPVLIDSAANALSSMRVLYAGVSYSEMMGFPDNQVTNAYIFPWYNNVAMNSQLRVSNLSNQATTISVYLGDDPAPIHTYLNFAQTNGNLLAGE
jgi:hypothetical protein